MNSKNGTWGFVRIDDYSQIGNEVSGVLSRRMCVPENGSPGCDNELRMGRKSNFCIKVVSTESECDFEERSSIMTVYRTSSSVFRRAPALPERKSSKSAGGFGAGVKVRMFTATTGSPSRSDESCLEKQNLRIESMFLNSSMFTGARSRGPLRPLTVIILGFRARALSPLSSFPEHPSFGVRRFPL